MLATEAVKPLAFFTGDWKRHQSTLVAYFFHVWGIVDQLDFGGDPRQPFLPVIQLNRQSFANQPLSLGIGKIGVLDIG